MKATLTINLPDEFKKMDCENCPVWGYCNVHYGFYKGKVCTDNCPLEIHNDTYIEPELYMYHHPKDAEGLNLMSTDPFDKKLTERGFINIGKYQGE